MGFLVTKRDTRRGALKQYALRCGVLLGAILLASCSREPAPNVLLVTFDTTRYDRFGCTGDPAARTPVVDALAKQGILFDRTYASAPLTLPSHTTMMTGLQPLSHGVHNNGRFRVPDELDTLAEILKAHLYTTAAFVSAFVLDPRFNLNQGFDVYNAKTQRNSDPLDMTVPQRSGEETTNEALGWLKVRDPNAPFFLWVHYFDPHQPRTVKPPFDSMSDEYRAEIAYADAQLGRLLAGVERASPKRKTLIIFTTDHGESLGQHGEPTHGLVAYDSTLHVALILAGPGVPQGVRSRILASHVDLLPTILTALHLPVPEGLAGRDLLHMASTTNPSEDDQVRYFENRGPETDLGWAPITGMRTTRWKYTASPDPVELYDIANDPDETNNLAAARPEVVAELADRFEQLEQSHTRPGAESARREIDPEEAQQLAALGYVEAAPVEAGEKPDPRRLIVAYGWVSKGRTLAMRGYYAQAIEVLETLAESHSVRTLVLRTLAPVYLQAGRGEDSIRAYRRYIELTNAPEARLGLASALLQVGRAQEALDVLDEISPRTTNVVLRHAQVLAHLGRYEQARQEVDAAYPGPDEQRERLRARAGLVIEVAPIEGGARELRSLLDQSPDDPLLRSTLGFYLASWGGPNQQDYALSLLRAAADAEPEDASILSNLGTGLHRAGLMEESKETLERALAIDDSRQNDRAQLAQVLFDLGQPEEAMQLLRIALTVRPAAEWSDAARALARKIEAELPQGQEEKPRS